jgi:hypothetical protein
MLHDDMKSSINAQLSLLADKVLANGGNRRVRYPAMLYIIWYL